MLFTFGDSRMLGSQNNMLVDFNTAFLRHGNILQSRFSLVLKLRLLY